MGHIMSGHICGGTSRLVSWRQRRRQLSPQNTFRVGELDAACAGMQMCMALRSVEIRRDTPEILDRVADAGPESRVGLVPQRDSRDWRIVANPGQSAMLPACTDHGDELEDTLRCLGGKRPQSPMAVWQCGSYTCIYCDHGLGDVRLIQKLGAMLTNPDISLAWLMAGPSNTRRPLLRALVYACGSRPVRMARDLVAVGWQTMLTFRERVAARNRGDLAVAEPADVRESSYSVAFASGSLIEQFRAHRDSRHPGASVATLLMHRMYRSFKSAGVDIPDDVDIPIDCRRYLPPGVTTQGNFQALMRVPMADAATPADFAESLKNEIQSLRPLVLLARWLLVTKLQALLGGIRRHPPGEELATRRTAPGKMVLTLVDDTRWVDQAAVKWRHAENSHFVGVVAPETHKHVGITLSASGDGRLQATATFYESQIDPGTVQQALERAIVLTSADHGR
ncbi:MAG: hypothetical protein JO044_09005 [Mycobacteriaceae bacterium]|nr:hypothetical protein [Mycobacteriaceae bacterium]